MHDFFDIVGLSRSAPPIEVRRVCARLVRRAHPDFHGGGGRPRDAKPTFFHPVSARLRREVAVDFLDMSSVIDRMQAAFFGERRG